MKKEMINETGDRNIFKVPEHYFEDFAASMEKRIDEFEADEALISDAPITTNIHPMMRLRPLLSIAAMFIVIAFSMGLIFHFTSNSSAELKAEETSSTDKIPTAEDYLISSVGTYGITQYYVETEANE
jgi:hypothetical protein